jgi:hypothetical protein
MSSEREYLSLLTKKKELSKEAKVVRSENEDLKDKV